MSIKHLYFVAEQTIQHLWSIFEFTNRRGDLFTRSTVKISFAEISYFFMFIYLLSVKFFLPNYILTVKFAYYDNILFKLFQHCI